MPEVMSCQLCYVSVNNELWLVTQLSSGDSTIFFVRLLNYNVDFDDYVFQNCHYCLITKLVTE